MEVNLQHSVVSLCTPSWVFVTPSAICNETMPSIVVTLLPFKTSSRNRLNLPEWSLDNAEGLRCWVTRRHIDRRPIYCDTSETKMSEIRRIDTEHHLLDLLQRTVDRIQQRSIGVAIDEREIVLSGRVENWHQKQQAQESVRSLHRSARSIRNDILVDVR